MGYAIAGRLHEALMDTQITIRHCLHFYLHQDTPTQVMGKHSKFNIRLNKTVYRIKKPKKIKTGEGSRKKRRATLAPM